MLSPHKCPRLKTKETLLIPGGVQPLKTLQTPALTFLFPPMGNFRCLLLLIRGKVTLKLENEIGYDEMVLRMLHGSGSGSEDPQLSTWQTPASSSGWAPGGEFAEALGWSSGIAGPDAASPHGGNGDSISLYEVAASCSSGVLLEPVVSPSDSSTHISPTLQVPPPNAEITSPWLYQSNAASAKATPVETSDRFRSQKKLKEKLTADKRCCLRTFQNREKGLKKKITELSTSCDIQACCAIYYPFCPRPHIWPGDQNEVESIAKEYMKKKKYQ